VEVASVGLQNSRPLSRATGFLRVNRKTRRNFNRQGPEGLVARREGWDIDSERQRRDTMRALRSKICDGMRDECRAYGALDRMIVSPARKGRADV
jgi:hypothetical protein